MNAFDAFAITSLMLLDVILLVTFFVFIAVMVVILRNGIGAQHQPSIIVYAGDHGEAPRAIAQPAAPVRPAIEHSPAHAIRQAMLTAQQRPLAISRDHPIAARLVKVPDPQRLLARR